MPTSLRRDYYLPYPIDPAQYWILAMDHGTGRALCTEEGSGTVVIVDATGSEQAVGAGPSQYRRPQGVNASVELFGQFLCLVQLALAAWGEKSVTDEDVQPLQRRLQTMDPAAISDLTMGLWPTVLEDIVTLS